MAKTVSTSKESGDPKYRLSVARLRATHLMPYLNAGLYAMIPVESRGLETMAVDASCRLYYNPDFVLQHDRDELAFVILHEALHILFRHCKRMVDAWKNDHTKTNIAADLAVNSVLMANRPKNGCDQLKKLEGAMYPDMFGLQELQQFEWYFGHLPDSQKGGDGKGPNTETGSGVDGIQKPWEDPPTGDGSSGGDQPDGGQSQGQGVAPPGLSEFEKDTMVTQMAQDIKDYEKTNGRGTVPGSLSREADDILVPKVDWRKELRASVRFACETVPGFGDYTYRKPSRRQPANGPVLPRHVEPVVVPVLLVDTSGSMGRKDFAQALGLIQQTIRDLGLSRGLRVIAADTEVHAVKNVFNAKQVELKGGGGTDMDHAIVQVSQLKPKPNVILVVTDGITPWPSKAVDAAVVVCLTQPEHDSYPIPKWMRKCVLNPDVES